MGKSQIKLSLSIVFAFVLWTFMFSPWTKTIIPFWYAMTASALALIALAWPEVKEMLHFEWKDLWLGIAIAVLLWGIFWVGDKVSQWIFPTFARQQVDAIYIMKDGMHPMIISVLLLFIIGPAEELFWRAYVQNSFCRIFSKQRYNNQPISSRISNFPAIGGAVLAITIYALVHLFSFNLMLILAAFVCGIIWGGLYYLMPHRLAALIISHALWDAAVFIWFPIM